MERTPRSRVRVVARFAVLAAVVGASAWLGWRWQNHNLATTLANRVYRSGQMPPDFLEKVVHKNKIKTVLNLRGSHPEEAWYRQEREATLRAGATQVDIAMSSCEWMSRAQAQALVQVLETCEYPILIHCWRGAERTGLVSAFTELLRPGATLADARGQFSWRYLFVPFGDGAFLPEHLDQYEAWLHAQRLAHSPGRFRQWVAEGFQPGSPSREEWPYDPYPLVVITRPSKPQGAADATRIGHNAQPTHQHLQK